MLIPDAGVLAMVWGLGAAAWLGLTWLTARRAQPRRGREGEPGGTPVPRVAVLILGVAFVLRALPVGLLPVSLSDDVWRYVHDGRTLARGENPYGQSPAEALADTWADADTAGARDLEHVNNPELVTIYQPASQWTFAATAAVTSWVSPRADAVTHARVLRGVFAAVDLWVVVLLLVELRRRRASLWWATLYAWSPAVFLETAWAGHQDGLGVLAVIATLMLTRRAARPGRRGVARAVAAGVTLAVAAAVKPVALPLALPLAWSLRRHPWRVAWATGACALALAVLYLPFVWMEGGLTGMLETGRSFATRWRFNGALHPLIEAAALGLGLDRGWGEEAKRVADVACLLLLLTALVVATLRLKDPWRVALVYLALMVGLSSTVHPWYLLWALGVLPVARAAARGWGPFTAAVWVAALALPWGYVAWLEMAAGRGYAVPLGVQVLCWGPILAAGLVGGWLRGKAQSAK